MRLIPWHKALPKVEAIELKRGGVYVIQSIEPLNAETVKDIEAYFVKVKERTGCEFILLDQPLRLVTSYVATEQSHGD